MCLGNLKRKMQKVSQVTVDTRAKQQNVRLNSSKLNFFISAEIARKFIINEISLLAVTKGI